MGCSTYQKRKRHPLAQDATQVASLGWGDVLPLGLVSEREEGLGNVVTRRFKLLGDCRDEDDGAA